MAECSAKTTCKAEVHYSHCPSDFSSVSTPLLQARLNGARDLMNAAKKKTEVQRWSVLANAIVKELDRRQP